ncbi:15316_t:CDS:2 [Racocetra persica]|uniref:15316_t:CDS:1 n=1 Tax=Racocetra persica TaxID=160502 RepID=A0ACA9KCD8_9GLOM|nr:15316_t:CDS:2 [Racocetra persica]
MSIVQISKSPLRSIEANTLVENLEPDTTNAKKKRKKNEAASSTSSNNVQNVTNSHSYKSKNTIRQDEQDEQTSNTSSSSSRNSLPENFSDQRSLASNNTPSFPNRSYSPEIINKHIIDELLKTLFSNIQNTAVLDRAALQTWAFGYYHDYNASLRRELRKLVPEFIRKHKLTKTKESTTHQVAQYISESNWMAFMKCHMDVTDVQKIFNDHLDNVVYFTNFIQSAFNLFVQESLLDKEVVNAVKNLNYMTVDLEIFMADGKDKLQKLDLRSLLKLD